MTAHIQGLLGRYEAALIHKDRLVNDKEPYYYSVPVQIKIRRRFLGIVVDPKYKTVWERHFNQHNYDQDMIAANNTLSQIGAEIQAALASLCNSVQSVNCCNYDYAACQARYMELSTRIKELDEKNNRTQTDISNASAQKQYYNNETQMLNSRLNENRSRNDHLKQECRAQSEANLNALKSADFQQRAFFLSELWLNKDAEINKDAINTIKSLGFDANSLAHYAILKNNEELFDLALSYKAACSNHVVDGKTLIQRLIHDNNEKFLQKLLQEDADFSVTILNAIDNDMLTINKLLDYDKELTKQKFFGYTLLQLAIDVKNEVLIKKILDIDSLNASILTDGGESSLKIAVRSGNDSIVKILASKVNLETEVELLGPEVSNEIKTKILEQHDIETVIELLKGDTKLLAQYTSKHFTNEDTDVFEFIPKFDIEPSLEELEFSLTLINLSSDAPGISSDNR